MNISTSRRRRLAAMSATLVLAAACSSSDSAPSTDTAAASTSTDEVLSDPVPSTATPQTLDITSAPEPDDAASATESDSALGDAADDTSESSSSDDDSAMPADGDTYDTTAGVTAALWSSNVSITLGDDTFTFASDGLPSHELPDQFLIPSGAPGDADPGFTATDTASLLSPAEISADISLKPVYSETVTDNPLGQIGVLISGAQLFNDFENMERSIIAIEDQTIIDGVSFLDACNGHPLASGDDYHYHGVPYCITDAVDVAGEHSTMIGVLRDGFPIYGNKDDDGLTITNADLDECSGHFGVTPEFPDGIYHYHLTDDAAPYSINCYHGVVDESVTAGGGPGGGGGGGRAGGGDAGPPAGERPPEPES